MTSVVLYFLVDKDDCVALDTLILNLTEVQLDLHILFWFIFFFGFFIVVSHVSDISVLLLGENVVKFDCFKFDFNLFFRHFFVKRVQLVFVIVIIGWLWLRTFVFTTVLFSLGSFEISRSLHELLINLIWLPKHLYFINILDYRRIRLTKYFTHFIKVFIDENVQTQVIQHKMKDELGTAIECPLI